MTSMPTSVRVTESISTRWPFDRTSQVGLRRTQSIRRAATAAPPRPVQPSRGSAHPWELSNKMARDILGSCTTTPFLSALTAQRTHSK